VIKRTFLFLLWNRGILYALMYIIKLDIDPNIQPVTQRRGGIRFYLRWTTGSETDRPTQKIVYY